MASASSPPGKSRTPFLNRKRWSVLSGIALPVALSIVFRMSLDAPREFTLFNVAAILAFIGALWLWDLHLVRGGFPRLLSFLLVVSFACLLSVHSRLVEDLAGLGAALFVYLMLWVFSTYEREPGLQPLATAALLISTGGFAKPVLAVACVLLCVGFFVFNRKLPESGVFGFALLLFTPAALCTATVLLVTLLTGGSLAAGPLGHPVGLAVAAGSSLAGGHAQDYTQLRFFIFPAAVLLTRLLSRRFGSVDLAFTLTLFLVATIGRAAWMPQPLQPSEVLFIALGGTAALLALTPPKTFLLRAGLLAVMDGSVVLSFAG